MFMFYAAAAMTLGIFIAAGTIIGAKSTSSSKDYSLGGRKSSAAGVTGILLGALVGGASTVGTVQMSYTYGLTACWFTLGAGAACLMLGLRFAAPLRNAQITTVADYLAKSYGGESFCGRAIAFTATVSASLGTFISICAQFLSCIAMLRGIFPLSAAGAAIAAYVSILGFIASGGLKSYSKLGEAKIVLLFFALIACFAASVSKGGTLTAVTSALPLHPWMNPFSQGVTTELGYFAAMVAGVFTTQIYIQSFLAAKDADTAKKGAFASALLMPPMGLLGIWIGLSVRASGAVMEPSKVLPWFIMDSFPPFWAGIVWGGILITVIGCAAGLVLGVATNIVTNLVPARVIAKYGKNSASLERALVFLIVAAAALAGVFGSNAMILDWSYLSMGLRGAGTLLPFVFAVMRPGFVSPKCALASSVGGLAAMLVWAFAGLGGEPLFAGLAASAICIIIGALGGKERAN